MNQMQIENCRRMADEAMDDMVAVTGIDLRPPRRQPVAQFLRTGDVMLNNIHVNNSTVGSINTGKIKTLDVAISAASAQNTDIAEALTKLAEATMNAVELQNNQKEEILELLSLLGDEAAVPKDRQRPGVIKAAWSKLSEALSANANVATIWQTWGPVIKSAFGLASG